MTRAVDYSGQRFGMLVAVKPTKKRSGGHILWECLCDCGNTRDAAPTNIKFQAKRGDPVSCGCADRRAKPSGYAACTALIARYRTGAKIRNIRWALSRLEAEELFKSDCVYCGAKPGSTSAPTGVNGDYTYSGIDRQNNSLGYILGNAVACCYICNTMKNNLEVDEFLTHVRRIAAVN